MNPTIISFDVQSSVAADQLAQIVPENAIRLSPLTYLLLSVEDVTPTLDKLGQAPALRNCSYTAISVKTPFLRHLGNNKAAQVLQDAGFEIV